MHYLIDGHNLIGQMADIDLADPDDEVKLIQRMRSWSARGRKRKVTIYFDHGLLGGMDRGLSSGPVKVIFAPSGRTADALLINRIRRVKNAAEYTLVSSDRSVIAAAENCRMDFWRSEEFARRMDQERDQNKQDSADDHLQDLAMNEDEFEMWLKMFTEEDEDMSR